MSTKLPAYQLPPDQLVCPYCENIFEMAMPVGGSRPTGIRKGHITICSNCGGVAILGDAQFRPMLPGEIEKLPKESQQRIAHTVNMVKATIARAQKDTPPTNLN